MQILPLLQHEVPRVAGHRNKHVHVLSRLKDEEEEEEEGSSEILSLNKTYNPKKMATHDRQLVAWSLTSTSQT